jgi:L-lysine 2,3-aminomutase
MTYDEEELMALRFLAFLSCLFCWREVEPINDCPDFVDDEDISQWAEYIATRPTIIDHLNNCLKHD